MARSPRWSPAPGEGGRVHGPSWDRAKSQAGGSTRPLPAAIWSKGGGSPHKGLMSISMGSPSPPHPDTPYSQTDTSEAGAVAVCPVRGFRNRMMRTRGDWVRSLQNRVSASASGAKTMIPQRCLEEMTRAPSSTAGCFSSLPSPLSGEELPGSTKASSSCHCVLWGGRKARGVGAEDDMSLTSPCGPGLGWSPQGDPPKKRKKKKSLSQSDLVKGTGK